MREGQDPGRSRSGKTVQDDDNGITLDGRTVGMDGLCTVVSQDFVIIFVWDHFHLMGVNVGISILRKYELYKGHSPYWLMTRCK